METNTGTTWNINQHGCIATLLSVTVGVAISLWQNECQSGRSQLLDGISTQRQEVDEMEDGRQKREG